MQATLPFKVEYQTAQPVPIQEIVDSLLSLQTLLEEAGKSLEIVVPGLTVERVTIRVKEISHGSLKEVLLIGLFAFFQEDLHRELPPLVRDWTGIDVPDNAETLLVILTLIALVYGIGFMKDIVAQAATNSQIADWKDQLIRELANTTGADPKSVEAELNKRYAPKPKMKTLVKAASNFFRPSKSQNNATIVVGDKRIEPQLIAEIPADYIIKDEEAAERNAHHKNVELELHQKDRDHEGSGWAAVPIGLHEKRLPMKLLDGIKPNDLWGCDRVRADIVLIEKRDGQGFSPAQIHLEKLT
jgi:hypothetical protein